jgi:hypothetical protein
MGLEAAGPALQRRTLKRKGVIERHGEIGQAGEATVPRTAAPKKLK